MKLYNDTCSHLHLLVALSHFLLCACMPPSLYLLHSKYFFVVLLAARHLFPLNQVLPRDMSFSPERCRCEWKLILLSLSYFYTQPSSRGSMPFYVLYFFITKTTALLSLNFLHQNRSLTVKYNFLWPPWFIFLLFTRFYPLDISLSSPVRKCICKLFGVKYQVPIWCYRAVIRLKLSENLKLSEFKVALDVKPLHNFFLCAQQIQYK